MSEVIQHPSHVAVWQDAADGKPVDWDSIFRGYAAAVDWPAASFYKQLMEKYPQAKVLLTARSFDQWYPSVRESIYMPRHSWRWGWLILGIFPLRFIPRWLNMTTGLVWEGTFQNRFEDKEFARKVYEDHVAEVKRIVPPQRLLVWSVTEGWEPLCKFLDKPVPNVPFPRVNDRAALQRRMLIVNIIGYIWGGLWLVGTALAARYAYHRWGGQLLGRF
jgi:hypothetical protein